MFPLWPSRLLHKFSICSTSPMSCRGGYCPRLQANKLDGQRLKTLDATNLPFSNVRYKQSQDFSPENTISVENICSCWTIFPPAAMKGSLSANQQTQENNGPVSRVPACPRVRVSRHNAASHKVCRPMMSGKSFEDSARTDIFVCLAKNVKTIFTLETENVLSRKLYKYFHYAGKYFGNIFQLTC